MQRVFIGSTTSIGNYFARTGRFDGCYTYKEAALGFGRCSEALLVAPASTLLGGASLSPNALALVSALKRAAAHIVFLSSVDVYASKGLPLDESGKAGGAPGSGWLCQLEQLLLESGPPATVLRLPDIFGSSIVRGVPGALISDGSKINRVAIHQWYPIRRLQPDITKALRLGVSIVNLVSEPLPMKAVLSQLFPGQIGHVATPAPYSRIKTRYANEFGGAGGYIMSAAEVLDELCGHVREERVRRSKQSKPNFGEYVPNRLYARAAE